jgi:hypothetical protein
MRSTIEMAREAGFYATRGWGLLPHVPEDIFIANVCVTEEVNRLVELARADEREACAKVCDDLPAPDVYSDTDKSMWDVTCVDCAEAIRARGETK